MCAKCGGKCAKGKDCYYRSLFVWTANTMNMDIIKLLTVIIPVLGALLPLFVKPAISSDTATNIKSENATTKPKITRFKTGIIVASMLMIFTLSLTADDWHTLAITCCAAMLANIIIVTCYYD